MHAGQPSDPVTGAVIPAISLSTTFQQASPGVHTGFEYCRTGNPTRNQYEALVAALEGGKYGTNQYLMKLLLNSVICMYNLK